MKHPSADCQSVRHLRSRRRRASADAPGDKKGCAPEKERYAAPLRRFVFMLEEQRSTLFDRLNGALALARKPPCDGVLSNGFQHFGLLIGGDSLDQFNSAI